MLNVILIQLIYKTIEYIKITIDYSVISKIQNGILNGFLP